ncbi:MAG TPA: hypothetical protein PK079_01385 [Leptospiraceae bacterium]|nr:hypothetical protein [Leptospiraceae bacterium]HMW04834.1 hypothetical protein [Leptospiraceae bacterium]HMX34757.1 hypothetical protein [Leptospiraceae bacterium]HMY30418.1 hypothetical protein [Leptospiraceae bacterium]HMZ64652.1 hypothetical protein [Leptospiraceae bacterium]
MNAFQFYGANLYSLDCIKTAKIYKDLFSLSILVASENHAELKTESGITVFIDRPSVHCFVTPGTVTFTVPSLDVDNLDLSPLVLESYFEKGRYASYLDEYKNRIWIVEKP